MTRALMLEGPHRGRVYEVNGSFLRAYAAMMNPGVEMPWDTAFQTVMFAACKMSMFGAIIHVWVPANLDEKERNIWALHRLIDRSLHAGLIDVADIPPEWAQPTVYTPSERSRELESGR